VKVGDLIKHKRFPLFGIIINIHQGFMKRQMDVLLFNGKIMENLDLRNFKILLI